MFTCFQNSSINDKHLYFDVFLFTTKEAHNDNGLFYETGIADYSNK